MKFLTNLKKRLKSQKGMSGVIVALLLVVIGVGLVAGVNTLLTNKTDDLKNKVNTQYTKATAGM